MPAKLNPASSANRAYFTRSLGRCSSLESLYPISTMASSPLRRKSSVSRRKSHARESCYGDRRGAASPEPASENSHRPRAGHSARRRGLALVRQHGGAGADGKSEGGHARAGARRESLPLSHG